MTHHRHPISFVATAKPDEARAFYGDVLGLTLVEQSPFALVYRDGPNMLRVQIVEQLIPAAHTVHGWQVTDIAQHVNDLQANGAVFEIFEQLGQDANGIWSTPDGNKIAWFTDPDGNILSLTEFVGAHS